MNSIKAEKVLKRLRVNLHLKYTEIDGTSSFQGWHCEASKEDEDDYGWNTLYRGYGVTIEEAIVECANDAIKITKELLDELQS